MLKLFAGCGKKICSVVFLGLLTVVLFAQSGKTAVTLYNNAYKMQQKGDYYSAIESYREALQMNPKYGDAWYNLALCTFNLGEYELAIEYADSAAVYSRSLNKIQNLKGMSLIAVGKIDEAVTVFNAVLRTYPNDIDARFGLAEIDLYKGSLTSAEKRYLDALKRESTNRKALLSLALVTAEEGKTDVAERYVNQALEYHSGEAEVHYLASYLAAKRGDLRTAEKSARSAVQIKGDYDKGYELLADILYAQDRYNEVIDLCEFRIGRNRNIGEAWYLKGLSQQRLGNVEEAIDTFNTGLMINPQDEVMRFAMEQLISSSLDVEDPSRAQWSQFHYNKATEYNKKFDGSSERYEYQRALSIDPFNIKARQSFANMLQRDGFYELYQNQLKFIKSNSAQSSGKKRTAQEVKNDDTIEALESMMRDSLGNRYGIDPFYLDKARWNIGIYYRKSPVQFIHADVDHIISVAARDIFNGVTSTCVDVQAEAIDGFAQAYRLARNSGRDYFIILSVDETDRSISVDAEMYSARTGTITSTTHIYRTGNDRVARSVLRLRQSVLDVLPIRGKILNNSLSTVLVDLGKSDGVVRGTEFDVVKKGKVFTADSGVGVYYNTKDIIGTFVIETVNEEISEGLYTKKGFYDTLNVGDEIVLVKIPGLSGNLNGNLVLDTRPQADSKGKPATESAAKVERDAIKEDLKTPARESSLIKMIRNIL